MTRKRQAVIVIHGIGEQRPMDTLRGFVRSIMLDFEVVNQKVLFYNKPDQLSDSFELRTLCVYPTEGRPRTDFFEYYWANNMRGTKLSHVFSWLWRMLLRIPSNVPGRIRWVYYLFWGLTSALVILVLTGIINPSLLKDYRQFSVVGMIIYLIVSGFNLFMIRYLGDAARYTDASPENIDERQKIRTNGIKLVKAIHDSEKYDRIIIVGHSLGTIIGYDIIKNLWSQYNVKHNFPNEIKQQNLINLEKKYGRIETPGSFSDFNLTDFQKDQEATLAEENALGNPWKITDFMTMGSPLTYASILLADTESELIQRQAERELPISPPIAEKQGCLSYNIEYKTADGTKLTKAILHHAAPFACTKWFNAYYENDYVGGPLQKVFGQGILDVPLKLAGIWGYVPFLSHTHYWADAGKSIAKEIESIERIRNIIIPDYPRKKTNSNTTEDIKQ